MLASDGVQVFRKINDLANKSGMIQSKLKIAEVYCLPWFFVITVFTGKSTYARKSASLERAPLFYHVKGALIWELHKKKIYNTANLPYSAIFFCK